MINLQQYVQTFLYKEAEAAKSGETKDLRAIRQAIEAGQQMKFQRIDEAADDFYKFMAGMDLGIGFDAPMGGTSSTSNDNQTNPYANTPTAETEKEDDDKKSSDKKKSDSGKAEQEGDPNAIGLEQVLAMLKKQAEAKDKDPAADDDNDDDDDEVVASTDTDKTTTTDGDGDTDDDTETETA